MLQVGCADLALEQSIWLDGAANRIQGGELLFVAANNNAYHALTTYKKKWFILNSAVGV